MENLSQNHSSISYIEKERRFVLETEGTAYVFDVSEKGHLIYVYWGIKLPAEDYPLLKPMYSFEGRSFTSPTRGTVGYEYIPWGEMVFHEPTLKTRILDVDRGMSLAYQDYAIEKEGKQEKLSISLEDTRGYYQVILEYVVYPTYDVIARRQTVKNQGGKEVALEAIRSFQTSLPREDGYRLTQLTGVWGGETHLSQEVLPMGKTTMESRRGHSGPTHNPWFAIDRGATEDAGEVWSGHLAYAGNWEIQIERDALNYVQISGGIHSFDFEWLLEPGESFTAPFAYLSYTDQGYTDMSDKAHRFQREHILPEANRREERKVLYNSWYATYFDVNEENQKKLAEKAAELGAELFVMDDGWFGERNHDQAGLGDWYVNPEKFPQGLTPLIEKVHDLDMTFGIWIEPEMTNRDSDLYRKNPDWVYHFEQIEPTESRNQLVLNLGWKEVREHVLDQLLTLLSTYEIDFLKWDMNRSYSEVNGKQLPEKRQKEVWVRHVQGIYEIMQKIREAHPDITIETCAGGGARIDLGILQHTDQAWASDNTDPYDRLFIQEGYSYAYSPQTMVSWVTDNPNHLNNRSIPLKFRFLSSMMGVLGIGGDLNCWTEEELEEAKKYIKRYKEIRPIVQKGKMDRIVSPRHQPYTITQYVSENKKEIVVFSLFTQQRNDRKHVQIRLRGLDEKAFYECKQLGIKASGKFFMNFGFTWVIEQEYDAELFIVKKV